MRTFVVITKIDMCQEHTVDGAVQEVQKLLTSHKKIFTVVKNNEDVLSVAQNFLHDKCVDYFSILRHNYFGCFVLFLVLFQYSWSPA